MFKFIQKNTTAENNLRIIILSLNPLATIFKSQAIRQYVHKKRHSRPGRRYPDVNRMQTQRIRTGVRT